MTAEIGKQIPTKFQVSVKKKSQMSWLFSISPPKNNVNLSWTRERIIICRNQDDGSDDGRMAARGQARFVFSLVYNSLSRIITATSVAILILLQRWWGGPVCTDYNQAGGPGVTLYGIMALFDFVGTFSPLSVDFFPPFGRLLSSPFFLPCGVNHHVS